eukprot:8219520-Pyramimonas_sp.AAC.1
MGTSSPLSLNLLLNCPIHLGTHLLMGRSGPEPNISEAAAPRPGDRTFSSSTRMRSTTPGSVTRGLL